MTGALEPGAPAMAASNPPPKIACPHCQALIKSPALPDGSPVNCPKCGQAFRLGAGRRRPGGPGASSQWPGQAASAARRQQRRGTVASQGTADRRQRRSSRAQPRPAPTAAAPPEVAARGLPRRQCQRRQSQAAPVPGAAAASHSVARRGSCRRRPSDRARRSESCWLHRRRRKSPRRRRSRWSASCAARGCTPRWKKSARRSSAPIATR